MNWPRFRNIMHNTVQNWPWGGHNAPRDPIVTAKNEKGYSDQPRANRDEKYQRGA
jgi:hypothetical protein